jgi:hypothetical protein
LNEPSKLIHPYCRLASLYSDIDSLFPYGGQDSYLREDRLNVLKLLGKRVRTRVCDILTHEAIRPICLGMKCEDYLVTWPELVERCRSIQNIRDYDMAYKRSLALLQILHDMLSISNSSLPRTSDEVDDTIDRRSRPATSNSATSTGHVHWALHDKDARALASTQLRDLHFIPIKVRPIELHGVRLPWMGEKYVGRLFKPNDILSQQYEQLICCSWPIAYAGKNLQEQSILSKQVEQFLGLDDTSKIDLRDILKQLDELAKLSIANDSTSTTYNHQLSSLPLLMCSSMFARRYELSDL